MIFQVSSGKINFSPVEICVTPDGDNFFTAPITPSAVPWL